MTASVLVTVGVGLVLVFFGRELVWCFVGAIGFFAGASLAEQQLSAPQHWVVLAIAVAAGVVGAVLAILLQRVAAGVAGLVAGGLIGASLAQRVAGPIADRVGVTQGALAWALVIVMAVIGAVVVFATYDWALIGLSTVVGSVRVVAVLHLAPAVELLGFAGLVGLGFLVQSAQLRRSRATRRGAS